MSRFYESVRAQKKDLEHEAQKICDAVSEVANQYGKPTEIKFVFLNEFRFIAKAEKLITKTDRQTGLTGGSYRIVLSEGYFIRLSYLFEFYWKLWSMQSRDRDAKPPLIVYHHDQDANIRAFNFNESSDVFRSIRPILIEEYEAKEQWEAIRKIGKVGELFDGSKIPSGPTLYLARFAIRFLVWHEVAHISRGHLEYVDSRKNTHTDGCNLRDPEWIKMRRLMEFDSDFTAVMNIMPDFVESFLHGNETGTGINPIELVLLIFGAVYSTFDFSARTISSYNKEAYPDPDIRLICALKLAVVHMKRRFGEIVDKIVNEALQKVANYTINANKYLGIPGGTFVIYGLGRDSVIGSRITEQQEQLISGLLSAQELWIDRVRNNPL